MVYVCDMLSKRLINNFNCATLYQCTTFKYLDFVDLKAVKQREEEFK